MLISDRSIVYMHKPKPTVSAFIVIMFLYCFNEAPITYKAIGTSIAGVHTSIGGLGDLANFTKYHKGLSSRI